MMIKRTIKSLMAFILAITMFVRCGDGDIISEAPSYSFDVGAYDYKDLYNWLASPSNVDNFDFNNKLPPQGSISSGNYNAEDNTFGDFNISSAGNRIKMEIKDLNFRTENTIPDSYPGVVYSEIIHSFVKGLIHGSITWNDETKRKYVIISGYYIVLYSTNNNWRTINEHYTRYVTSDNTSSHNIDIYELHAHHAEVSNFLVAVAAVPNIVFPDPYTANRVIKEVLKDQGLLKDPSRRAAYLASRGMSDIAIRFFEIVDDNSNDHNSSFNWPTFF